MRLWLRLLIALAVERNSVKNVFVTQRSDCTTQTEEETHSVLVVVEGPASD